MQAKLLVLSQFFYPDELSTGKVLSDLIFALDNSLFDINVISGRRLYQDKSNTILASYEKINNVIIHRVLKMFMSKEKPWGRLFNYFSFFLMCLIKLVILRLPQRTDIIFTVSNPPIIPLLGAWFKNDKNKFVYLIHDLYPDIAIKLGVVGEKNIMSRVMFQVNRYVFKMADVVIVLGRDMKEYVVKNYNVPPEKIEVLPNWSKCLNVQRKSYPRSDKFRLLYTGNLGKFHDLELAVYAAERLPNKFELFFVGEGAKKKILQQIVTERKLANVHFIGYVEQEHYENMLAEADALLLSLEKGLSGLAVPSKFYTYMAAGKPIVAIVDNESEVALTIREETCGIIMNHDDVDGFVNKISKLIENPQYCNALGENALRAFEEKYEQSIVIKKYEELFCKLCEGVK